MNDASQYILTLIAKLVRERDTFQRMLRDTVKQVSELSEENARYAQELERHARAMRRARAAIRNRTNRNDFDHIYSRIMGGQ